MGERILDIKEHEPNSGVFIAKPRSYKTVTSEEAAQLREQLGLRAQNHAARNAGTRHHARKAVAERLAGGSIGLGRILVIAAMLLLLILCLVWR
jgi:hypothetical protein